MSGGARAGLAERAASSAVEVSRAKPPGLVEMIKAQTEQVALALPTHLKHNAEAYVRSAITLIKQNPGLAKCDPLTILGGLMTASQLGLELGPLQLAYLVPYGSQAQLQIGYRGYIELGYRSGMLADITAETVKENDQFSFDRARGEISHTWDPREPRGKAYAWYASANFKDGGRVFVVLGREDVEFYRSKSKQPNSPMWRDNYDAAAKKTCIRRLEPYLPKSTEIARAFVLDGSVARGVAHDNLEVEQEDFIDAEAVDEETGEITNNGASDGALFAGQES